MTDSDLVLSPENAFHAEGGFLFGAERQAESLERRVREAHTAVATFRFARGELRQIAENYARTVAIARAYHVAAAGAAQKVDAA